MEKLSRPEPKLMTRKLTLRSHFMQPRLSHHSKIYALRSEIVYGSAG